jgi:hypothetical protein
MNWTLFAVEALKFILPAAILAVTVVYIIRSFMMRDQQLRLIESKIHLSKDAMIIRLQAYERMALLLERMHPSSLINRLLEPGMTTRDLQFAMVTSMHTEVEHNFAQQIYISADAWNLIISSKKELIKMVTMMASTIDANAPAQQFANTILRGIENVEEPLPSQVALDFLKSEAKNIL